ncbi:hypothetical protein Dsin_025120 [Dipteronia sinensis]|uniref:Uncharacterized protein n=1 Tax=Dipteronia sinensis TaxID=43782 RepID=A0AAD9ZVH5_9ROSI|nr:hypothetical protein Dsin_025120 [Dipteronia sinensis]
MEATLLTSRHFTPQLFTTTKPLKIGGGHLKCDSPYYCPLHVNNCASVKMCVLESSQTHMLSKRPLLSRTNRKVHVNSSDRLQSDYMNVEPSSESINPKVVSPRLDDGADILSSHDVNNYESLQSKPTMFRNRFLNFVRLSSVLNSATESFF